MYGWTGAVLLRRALTMTGLALVVLAGNASTALAHCDTMDGPVVTAARKSLESGSVGHILMWVRKQDEAEVKSAFERTRAVRKLGAEAQKLADMYFFETVVRLHRQGEGEPYTGLKPAGTDLGKAIPAADKAIASGSVDEVEKVLVEAVRHGLHERFERVVSAKNFTPGDVEAGRRYVAAYVPLLHYVEGIYGMASGAHHEAEPATKKH